MNSVDVRCLGWLILLSECSAWHTHRYVLKQEDNETESCECIRACTCTWSQAMNSQRPIKLQVDEVDESASSRQSARIRSKKSLRTTWGIHLPAASTAAGALQRENGQKLQSARQWQSHIEKWTDPVIQWPQGTNRSREDDGLSVFAGCIMSSRHKPATTLLLHALLYANPEMVGTCNERVTHALHTVKLGFSESANSFGF